METQQKEVHPPDDKLRVQLHHLLQNYSRYIRNKDKGWRLQCIGCSTFAAASNKMAEGAKAAGEDLGVNVTVSAPNTASSLDEQVGLIETAISPALMQSQQLPGIR